MLSLLLAEKNGFVGAVPFLEKPSYILKASTAVVKAISAKRIT
jgi:hypothetical protein